LTDQGKHRNKLQGQHLKEKMDIIGIMTRLEQEFQEAEADSKHEYQSLRDDVKNKVSLTTNLTDDTP
jgi:hypothetical protein